MSIIDLVKWNGNPSILAWRFPSDQLSTWTQLVVNETQEAFLVKEGVYQGPFGAGRYTLDTENIPLLASLMGLPFGGKTPFTAEVWFINRIINLDIKWGTPDPIQLEDPKYKLMLPVRAFGQYGIKINDPKKFLLKLVGTLPGFDAATITDYFRGQFITKIKTHIAQAIIVQGTSVLEMSSHLESLSELLKNALAPDMEEYGIGLLQFNVNSINVPESDPAVISLKAALAKRTEMGILGFNYQQERSFDVLQSAASNEGNASNIMGAGLGVGMGVAMGGAIGSAFGQIATNNLDHSNELITCPNCKSFNNSKTKFCSNCGLNLEVVPQMAKINITCDKCGASLSKTAKFCHNCADEVNPCPECGDDNSKQAKKCKNCGIDLPLICSNCNASVDKDFKFPDYP